MDLALVEKGLKNWKKCPEVFTSLETSKYHRNCVKLLNDEETTNKFANEISDIHIKKSNRQILLQILQNIQFFTRQGLAFWSDNGDENIDRQLKRCEKLDSCVTEW